MAKHIRSIQEINQDYFQTAAVLGDLVWKVSKFTGENLEGGQIGDLKRKLRTIDNEMDEVQKEKAKEDQKKAASKNGGIPGLAPKPSESNQETAQQ